MSAWLQKMTCYFDNCICHQNCNCDMVLRDDARLVLVTAIYIWAMWAMQPLWSTTTIEIHPQYMQRSLPLIGHFNNTVITLGLLWYQTNCIRHLPGSWSRFPHWQSWNIHKVIIGYTTVSSRKFSCPDGNMWLPHRCLVVRVCRIPVR